MKDKKLKTKNGGETARNLPVFFLAFFFLFLCLGCQYIVDLPKDNMVDPVVGNGYLFLRLGADAERTIMPKEGQYFAWYILHFYNTDPAVTEADAYVEPEGDPLLVYEIGSGWGRGFSIALPAGHYDLYLSAYARADNIDASQLAAQGRLLDIKIAPEETVNANMTLAVVETAENADMPGFFVWDIHFRSDRYVDPRTPPDDLSSATITVEALDKTLERILFFDIVEQYWYLYGEPKTPVESLPLPKGEYRVVFDFICGFIPGGQTQALVTEILHIYPNVASVFDETYFVFSGEYFTIPVIDPVTNIVYSPATAVVDVPFLLGVGATIQTANGDDTEKTIVWSVKDGPAVIDGSTLTITAVEDVVVIARILNGIAIGTDYTQEFTISSKTLTGITLDTSLVKLAGYHYGESLDLTNLVVTAAYSYGPNAVVTGYTTNPADGTIPELETFDAELITVDITVSYTEWGITQTASFSISVSTVNITVTNTATWNNVRNLITNRGNNQKYTITVNGDVGAEGSTGNTFGSVSGLEVTVKGDGKLYLTSQGNLIRVVTNQTFIIDSPNLILQGLTIGRNAAINNDTTLVYVDGASAKLELRSGTIGGNAGNFGGGVCLLNGGSFIMSGGSIYDNTATFSGGGVDVGNGSSFTMSGGNISGNTAAGVSIGVGEGGGVYVSAGGSFTMTGGTISGNTAAGGGGVCIRSDYNRISSFVKSGNSIIYGNDAGNENKNTKTYADFVGHAVWCYFLNDNAPTTNYYLDKTQGVDDNLNINDVSKWEIANLWG